MQYLGVISYQNENHEEAAGLIKRAIEIQPGIPDFHNNLGLVFHAMGELERAAACYRQAIALNANYVEAWNNLGLSLEADGQPAEAIPCYERAIALQPDFAQAHWNLSLVLLVTGDFPRGWREYEWRLKTPELAGRAQRFSQPAWNGEPLGGKTILLHPEQGFGDAIQFIRYVPLITALGGKIMVEVQPALKRLFAQIPGIERVIAQGEPLPHFDVHCPLLSLPFHFG
jgi:tetratricopeptide (TPR) repeat protein